MEPAITAGSFVLIHQTKKIREGDVVAFRRLDKIFIKRISSILESGYEVLGDNPDDSQDSRDFGLVQTDAVIGKVIWH